MRIIGGAGKSRRIATPRGRDTRPTADRVREALFNILAPRLPGSRFLDLYAGSGAVGLEALSRGAEKAVFVERHRPTAALIRENISTLQFTDRATVCQSDVYTFLSGRRPRAGTFEIVFLDPPYAGGDAERMLRAVSRSGLLSDDGVVVMESARAAPPPDRAGGLILVQRRYYGDTALSFYQTEGA